MKILRCHIENFGKLKDLTIDFSSNPCIIYENNGWGKSTLAAFIKVMFYGFANEGKRSDIENERKKYKPWQGGAYGGELAFEINGKSYEFTRNFGAREKEDTFTLRNLKTNLLSEDYSANLGEELFKIDRESFTRTIFIAQNDIATNATDSINAKIGNLVDNTDDINNYDTAQKVFKDLLLELSPTRKTGTIKKKEEQVSRLQLNVGRAPGIERAIGELTETLDHKKAEKDKLKDEQTIIQRQMEQISGYKDLQNKKTEYDRICSEYKRAVDTAEKEQQYFPAAVPTEAELEELQKEAAQLAVYQGELQSLELTGQELQKKTSLEQQFYEGVPGTGILEEYKEKIQMHEKLMLGLAKIKPSTEDEEMLAELKHRFREPLPDHDALNQMISLWNQRTELKSRQGANQAALNALKSMNAASQAFEPAGKTNQSPAAAMVLLAGILVMIPGLLGILRVLFNTAIGGICIGTGMVLIMIAYLMKSKQRQNAQPEAANQTAQKDMLQRTESWQELEYQIAEDQEVIQAAEHSVRTFLQQYGFVCSDARVISDLYELKDLVQDYNELHSRKQQYEASGLHRESRELEAEIKDFLLYYYPQYEITAGHFSAGLRRLEEDADKYKRLKGQADKYKKAQLNYHSSYQRILDGIEKLKLRPSGQLTAFLQELRDHVRALSAAVTQAEAKRNEKEAFEHQNILEIQRCKELEEVNPPVSLEAVNERFSEITKILEGIETELVSYHRQMDTLSEERELIDEDQEQLRILKEELEADRHRYEILSRTKDYLEMAKENFTARYIGPIMTGFAKYHRMLAGEDISNYKIDANINITAKEQGEQRSPKLLSTGYQDLIGLCMRMALIDAMFQEETPFIIIDDSFVNLDNEKVKGGLKFLSEVAREYQVIYFTCHESRVN